MASNFNTSNHTAPASVLLISATDSGGCAGMQADMRVCGALRTFATCAVTAVTAQNSGHVADVMPVPPAVLKAQITTAWEQQRADAVKIGLLPTVDSVEVVADELTRLGARNIIFDPVMAATAGPFLDRNETEQQQWIAAVKEKLLPVCTLVTPNLPEMVALDLSLQGGVTAILVKGGHADQADHFTDFLYLPGSDTPIAYHLQRIDTCNLRGTGCTLSSAIACYMARGLDLHEAVTKAEDYLQDAIRGAVECSYDGGPGPVDHFARLFDF